MGKAINRVLQKSSIFGLMGGYTPGKDYSKEMRRHYEAQKAAAKDATADLGNSESIAEVVEGAAAEQAALARKKMQGRSSQQMTIRRNLGL